MVYMYVYVLYMYIYMYNVCICTHSRGVCTCVCVCIYVGGRGGECDDVWVIDNCPLSDHFLCCTSDKFLYQTCYLGNLLTSCFKRYYTYMTVL